MIGWHITCYPKPKEKMIWEEAPHSTRPILDETTSFAQWSTTLYGLEWIMELVETAEAELLADNGGYPFVYELPYRFVEETIKNPPWLRGPAHVNKPVIPPERVIVIAWDES